VSPPGGSPDREGERLSSPRPEGILVRERSPVGGWPIAAAIAVIGLLLYGVRHAILPFVFAAAIGFVTDPLIEAARRRTGWRRGIVAALAYVVLLAVFALVAYTIGSNAVRELTQLVERAPSIARNIIGYIVGDRGIVLFGTAYDTDTVMRELAAAVKGLIGTGLAAQVGLSLIGFAAGLAMTLVLTPFFMISGPRLAAGTIWLIPPERRRSVMVLLPRIVPVLQRYLVVREERLTD
jgi:predicted PurR-regulated permease PerM